MKMIVTFLMAVLFGLQYKLWFGDAGVVSWIHLKQKSELLAQENKTLQTSNRAVEANVLGLKSGAQALEEQARYELGMIKEGEEYYQFVE